VCACASASVSVSVCVCVCFCEACLCAKVLIEENLSPHKCSLRYANWNITATVARGVREESKRKEDTDYKGNKRNKGSEELTTRRLLRKVS